MEMSDEEFYEKCKEVFKKHEKDYTLIFLSEEGKRNFEKLVDKCMREYILNELESSKLYKRATNINHKNYGNNKTS